MTLGASPLQGTQGHIKNQLGVMTHVCVSFPFTGITVQSATLGQISEDRWLTMPMPHWFLQRRWENIKYK